MIHEGGSDQSPALRGIPKLDFLFRESDGLASQKFIVMLTVTTDDGPNKLKVSLVHIARRVCMSSQSPHHGDFVGLASFALWVLVQLKETIQKRSCASTFLYSVIDK